MAWYYTRLTTVNFIFPIKAVRCAIAHIRYCNAVAITTVPLRAAVKRAVASCLAYIQIQCYINKVVHTWLAKHHVKLESRAMQIYNRLSIRN